MQNLYRNSLSKLWKAVSLFDWGSLSGTLAPLCLNWSRFQGGKLSERINQQEMWKLPVPTSRQLQWEPQEVWREAQRASVYTWKIIPPTHFLCCNYFFLSVYHCSLTGIWVLLRVRTQVLMCYWSMFPQLSEHFSWSINTQNTAKWEVLYCWASHWYLHLCQLHEVPAYSLGPLLHSPQRRALSKHVSVFCICGLWLWSPQLSLSSG